MSKRITLGFVFIALLLVVAACSNNDSSSQSEKTWELQGAGASFPNPLYQEMFADYNQKNPNIRINYTSTGSGAGQRQLVEGTVQFAGSDAFMSEEMEQDVTRGVIHVPMTIGAVAVIYNLPGIESGLKLTQDTLADIYLGKITKWNDAKIKEHNPSVNLPNTDITVVYRSEGSGTTSIYTDYLSSVNAEWKDKVGMGTSVSWPVGIGARSNDGVAGQVRQLPGAIGYVELAYATENNLPFAALRNQSGKFVEPSLAAASLASASAAENMPEDTKVSLVNMPGDDSYGIVGFSWIMLYGEYPDKEEKQVILDFVKWMYRDGQVHSEPLHYAKIPESIAQINDRNLAKIK